MLKELRIKNFAIIDNLNVEFSSGFTALTGETGAGKSIIIDALNLILGGRADSNFIRTGESSATVESLFEVTNSQTLDLLLELGININDGEVVIRRTISSSGKNRCLINDCSVSVGVLARLGNRLVDIHGQHDHQALLNPEIHVDLLDLYGKTMDERNELTKKYYKYLEDIKKIEDLRIKESDRMQREDLLHFQIKEIDTANLSIDEEGLLKSEKNKLQYSEKIHGIVKLVLNLISEKEGAILDELGVAKRELESLPLLDPELGKQAERVQSAFCEIEELTEELRDYGHKIEFNPSRLEEIEDRLSEINGLKRKYGGDITLILDHREKISNELDTLSCFQENMEKIQKNIKLHKTILSKHSIILAEKREKTASMLKKNVEKELCDLGMKDVRLKVQFNYEGDDVNFIRFRNQKVKLNSTGLGTIEFLFSPNLGEDLKPLVKIASGGELSRLMLALKSNLNKQDTIPVMVFDEVDAGIGGKIAEVVGDKLKKIAAEKQVFCITHLPQIAGKAVSHFVVFKMVKEKRTYSSIRELSKQERVEEVARMSGGKKITEATLNHAREMIQP
ncbi:MAG: DNA repair protein RecN [Nitrospina sp.]|jgi:DNA repair protein RecN (Recombination protein N)|nr:DNA repair protein RecN [Nitrospina sp.]MBT6601235.1 DNA repair protein RecN [Nitrospina sp.]